MEHKANSSPARGCKRQPAEIKPVNICKNQGLEDNGEVMSHNIWVWPQLMHPPLTYAITTSTLDLIKELNRVLTLMGAVEQSKQSNK